MPSSANRLGIDYRLAASEFPRLEHPIIDAHSHLNSAEAAKHFREVADLYGIGPVYSMTPLSEIEAVKSVMGHRVRFIAIPRFGSGDPKKRLEQIYTFDEALETYFDAGARIAKFWAAPRGLDFGKESGDVDALRLNAPHRRRAMQRARDLGMAIMVHVADPDTWFSTRYRDSSFYGTKRAQYDPFFEVLEEYPGTWIAAHMGGWPEDLEFLDSLLASCRSLYLDTSATKWMVRELSKHDRSDLVSFLAKWQERILFGSDIVANTEHLSPESQDDPFELYASRYWALRTLWETDYSGESPIVDLDLAAVDPDHYGPKDAPLLLGRDLPRDLLRRIYYDNAMRVLEPLYSE